MPQNQCFYEQSVFLCHHQAIKQFAKNYVTNYEFSSNQHWSIICERKEDIVTIRNQLFIEIGNIQKKEISILNGISIYTLDTLVQKICASLAHINDNEIRQQVPNSLFQPYIDINSQEKLVEIILNLFGYNGSDSLALAKQILTLLDIQLPPETNFVELIIATQGEQRSKITQQTSEISLRQILATIQQSKLELAQYARFQIFVNEYLNQFFLRHTEEILGLRSGTSPQGHALLPYEILSSPILWVGAPEYLEYEQSQSSLEKLLENNKTLKPGNFQSDLVDDFKNGIKKIQEILSKHNPGFFYESRTILATQLSDEKCGSKNLNVYLSTNDQVFFHSTDDLMMEKNEERFVLLADFDPNNFQAIHPSGSGAYQITKKDLEQWKRAEGDNAYFNEIRLQIDEKYDEFLDTLSYIQNKNSLQEIARIYSLKLLDIDENTSFELFMSHVLKEKITIGAPHSLATAPKVLSFFNSATFPKKIVCVGRPHHSISQSFNVKILNQVFFLLKQKGVSIEIPASETMYRLFWKNLISEAKQIDFWIADKKELEQFPNFIKINNIFNLNTPLSSNFNFHFKTNQEKIIPQWKEKFLWESPSISITQFEDYVMCPHKFFLKYLLNVKKDDPFKNLDLKEIGTRMHQIGEQLITRLVTLFGNEGYINETPSILSTVIETLKAETLFLSFDKNIWLQAISVQITEMNHKYTNELLISFEESIDLIWKDETDNSFISLQQREILKRTFLKFLQTEHENLKNSTKAKVGLYREFPIHFDLAGLKLSGRIDRIDLTSDGLEIIDYKTSNISKSQKEIILSPSLAKGNHKAKLSVQGALYTYGFAKSYFISQDEAGDDILLNKIKYYSLYFLKNLDENKNNCVKYSFASAFEKENLDYMFIENDYHAYATNLLQGQFSANPIQDETTCLFCEFKPVCPNTYQEVK